MQDPENYITGRIKRKTFIVGSLILFLLLLVLTGIYILTIVSIYPQDQTEAGAVAIAFTLAITGIYILLIGILMLLKLSLYIRRFHDTGHSGLYTLATLVPILNITPFLYCLFAPSTPQANKYGAESGNNHNTFYNAFLFSNPLSIKFPEKYEVYKNGILATIVVASNLPMFNWVYQEATNEFHTKDIASAVLLFFVAQIILLTTLLTNNRKVAQTASWITLFIFFCYLLLLPFNQALLVTFKITRNYLLLLFFIYLIMHVIIHTIYAVATKQRKVFTKGGIISAIITLLLTIFMFAIVGVINDLLGTNHMPWP